MVQILSRTQRRMERRQAMLLLALVLAVSLVSFALGVMVGRGKEQTAVSVAPEVERVPVGLPGSAGATPAEDSAPENLTFYESLPKGGKPPLGSGINLPPSEEPRKIAPPPQPAAQPAAPTVSPAASKPPVQPAEARAASTLPASKPPTAQPRAPVQASASWIIQVGSFQAVEDARKLQERLGGKGYAAFVQEANLAEKGIWYRVMIGPFASEDAASGAAGRLRSEEKMPVLVRRS